MIWVEDGGIFTLRSKESYLQSSYDLWIGAALQSVVAGRRLLAAPALYGQHAAPASDSITAFLPSENWETVKTPPEEIRDTLSVPLIVIKEQAPFREQNFVGTSPKHSEQNTKVTYKPTHSSFPVPCVSARTTRVTMNKKKTTNYLHAILHGQR